MRRGAVRTGRGKAGETLTETLIAMLIIGLSSVLFLTMIGASGRIFRKTEEKYDDLYDIIAAADVRRPSAEITNGDSTIGSITIKKSPIDTGTNIPVDWYGDKDYVLSYEVR